MSTPSFRVLRVLTALLRHPPGVEVETGAAGAVRTPLGDGTT